MSAAATAATAGPDKSKMPPASSLPRPVLHTIGREGLVYHAGPRKLSATEHELVNAIDAGSAQPLEARRVVYSENGQFCAVLQANGVLVLAFDDTNVDQDGKPITAVREIANLEMPNTVNAALSPHGSFVVTLTRPIKGQEKGNLCVWSLPKANQDGSASVSTLRCNLDGHCISRCCIRQCTSSL
jgi:hypothetical protein